ncbi:hypothetical protein LJC21_02085 [Bacteroides sp. OttesenSCG-928-E20]|nr:hypothetical protein [Bacteroides sp. OttesenSCG-928-N06]MDL2299479.1 hypothetical protein [Bacteroides sp. OttesenSCG-928-E20]
MRYVLFVVLWLWGTLTVAAQTPEQIKSWLPAIDGWVISDKVEVFTPDNLFNRINGSAPLFLENNFKEMTALEYTRGEEYITIQVYRHGSAEDTFGMYASERSPDMNFFAIGGEAQGDDTNLYFFVDNVYVKMWANGSDALGGVVKDIATGLAQQINPDATYPVLIKLFPIEGKLPYSEVYITSNYIGHTFLNGVYTSNYEVDGQLFQAFLIDAKTVDGAKSILADYFRFTKQSPEFEQGNLVVTDRYNGDIPVIWKDRYIIGVFSESGDSVAGAGDFLKNLAGKLP